MYFSRNILVNCLIISPLFSFHCFSGHKQVKKFKDNVDKEEEKKYQREYYLEHNAAILVDIRAGINTLVEKLGAVELYDVGLEHNEQYINNNSVLYTSIVSKRF